MQINFTNFIRFYAGNVEDETINIPRLAIIDNKCYCPVYVPGERAAFYINSSVPFLDGDNINDLQLRVLNVDGSIVNNQGVIIQKVVLSTGYRMYVDFSFPDIPNKQYQFQIFNTNTNVPKCISNWFQVLDFYKANAITALVVWRNSRSAYYYDWSMFPDFYCRVRLHLSLQSYTPEGTVEQLQSVNTGRRRNLNRTVDKSVKLQTYYFDDGANDACIALFEADNIQINGKAYLSKTIYNPNSRANSLVSTGEIELYEQDFSSVNKYGQLPIQLPSVGYIAFWNKSAASFSFKSYLENNILFETVNIAPGGTLFYNVSKIPYNGRVDVVPAIVDDYDVSSSVVRDSVAVFNESVQGGAIVISFTRAQVYGANRFIIIGGNTIETIPITLNVTEQAVPYIDANGQVKVGGTPEMAIYNTGSNTINVPVGSIISSEAFVQNDTTATDPLLTHKITKNGVDIIYNQNTPAVNGASLVGGFTAESGASYVIDITTSGS